MTNRYILQDNLLRPLSEKLESKADVVVYEVIRFIDGIPLFFDDHFKRLKHSLELVNQLIELDPIQLLSNLMLLAEKNEIRIGNLMLQISFSGSTFMLQAWFIPHKYPTEVDYEKGVTTDLLYAERNNPEAKVVNNTVRDAANNLIAEKGVYEVLLVNNQNGICEGSRTNFFAVKGNVLHTAPLNKVLHGITLLKVLDIAAKHKIPVVFEEIKVSDLANYDALFLTGTSPKVLPISSVGELIFCTKNEILRLITDKYNELIASDIKQKKGHR